MEIFSNININSFDYLLPDEKIAIYPLVERDMSKLLIRKNNKISEDIFRNIANYLPNNSLILSNDTKVINARLVFTKETGSKIEIFCLEPSNPSDYVQSLSSNKSCTWKCLIGNNKKWKSGCLYKELRIKNRSSLLKVSKLNTFNGSFEILFEWNDEDVIFSEILENFGNIPVPPYLNRDTEDIDKQRYQTIYSRNRGSVAAPTAGLHFTEQVFANLHRKNIIVDNITLHVGAGTFKPVKANNVAEHEMHTEFFVIKKQTIENIITNIGNITVVGTTTVRTIESVFQVGIQILNNPEITDNHFFVGQWEAYKTKDSKFTSEYVLTTILDWMIKNNVEKINCSTKIMILPSYEFKLTDRLITNFHQPKSTLLLLLAAFIGNSWKDVYNYALNNDFRFLSYGDSSLFFNEEK
jgi:S-adenosylmethionine:tRNA ribosyltransferase-isomerase